MCRRPAACGGGTGQTLLLLAALAIAFGFECVNGFHDTASAVATVIYTKSTKPTPAPAAGCRRRVRIR